ncbi:MAG: hypothetical protein NTX16_13785 [Actinobacteria bacterium]|nr:hypothetical protein [Actinomycetota bacterium]
MPPLRGGVLTRRFPVVTLVVILLNVAVFAFELTLPRFGMTLGGFLAGMGLGFALARRPRRAPCRA